MKTATITFHAAHNYGAMLQAFAFQKFLLSLGVENEIIDLRTKERDNKYPYPSFSIYRGISKIFHILDVYELRIKYKRFKSFINDELILSSRVYCSAGDVNDKNCPYDIFIAAGDQIWNPKLEDWSIAYLLPEISSPKFSYAVSMGAKPEITVEDEKFQGANKCLKQFSSISVREQRSASTLFQHFGISADVHIDPAFLLSSAEWDCYLSKSIYQRTHSSFVFIYSPKYNPILNQIGSAFGKALGSKTIITDFCSLTERIRLNNFTTKQKSGPWEFLWMIRNASFVLCMSFHAVVFSIIFHKPFYFLDSGNDSRVHSLLSKMGLEDRIIAPDEYKGKISKCNDINFEIADKVISKERERSRLYIMRNLGLNG